MDPIVYSIPTKSIGYDWTFQAVENTYDRKDYDALLNTETVLSEEEETKESPQEAEELKQSPEEEEEETKESPQKNRKQPQSIKLRQTVSKIDTSLFITCNDMEFILSIALTPGKLC